MQIIDGKLVAKTVREKLKVAIENSVARFGAPIGLAVIIAGDNPASKVYVKNKAKAAEELGIASYIYELPELTTQDGIFHLIDKLNADRAVNGILVQLPLPSHLDEKTILRRIDPAKDVDGFSPYQAGRLAIGEEGLVACTPAGVMELFKYYDINLRGANAVIVGRSNIVGKPMFHLLLQADATVTVCHTKTKDLASITSQADILIAAVGRANMITANMVKEGAVVIDVGINRTASGLVGDVDFESVAPKCSYITPVPGGVGPMTIAMLMSNTLKAYKEQNV
ncbi:MAG: bifunctional methylenetetrahydrofolate dehydrogenase/methenyltetrahydrofolate cyclohydrolase FolD [Clostridia bacterium]